VFVGRGMAVVVVAVVVVVVSCETVVAAFSCLVATGIVFGISSSIFGKAQSHLTQK
jgi:preprotein translocase subunit SecF